MAKTNYSWEKRQRELAKQKKRDEKLKKKHGDKGDASDENSDSETEKE